MLEATEYSSFQTTGLQLAENLAAILKVAGPTRHDGKESPLRTTVVQRKTKIARSTLRALQNTADGFMPNPDLGTLSRLANLLGIPVAFLLMGPKEWNAIIQAINGIRAPHEAADTLVNRDGTSPPNLLEMVLSTCGIHPDSPPNGGYENRTELARMAARNEWRLRNCRVFSALIKPGEHDRTTQVLLAAFAASYINQTTPQDPSSGQ